MEVFLLVTTLLLTSMAVGVILCFSLSVNKALSRLKDRDYLQTMRFINRFIENGVFLTAFLGPVILLPLVTALYAGPVGTLRWWLFVKATILFIVGTFGVTMMKNVPMNRWLDRVQLDESSEKELGDVRKRYETPWNRFHTIRTVLGVLAVAILTWAVLA